MKISVVIPAHNAGKTLEKTLASLDSQTLAVHEVIIVDDGSTPPVDLSYRPIRTNSSIVRTTHHGAGVARNIGARLATGDALFFCDADIELKSTALEELVGAFRENPDAAFAYSAFEWGGKIFGNRDFDPAAIQKNNYISTMSLIRRSAFPGFDETLPRFQDWDLWLTVIERGSRGVRVPEVLFRVLEEGSMSRQGGLSRLLSTARIRRKHRLPWRWIDFWLAFKESVRAKRL